MEQAAARDTADRAKERLEVYDAGLGLKIRANPAQFGLEKITESSVQAVILLDKEHARLSDELNTARYQLEVIAAAVRALDQKKSALENLVRLQGQNYFAGPSVPREIGKEWVKEVERNGARDKVKEAMIKNEHSLKTASDCQPKKELRTPAEMRRSRKYEEIKSRQINRK
jgi:hypothetical protein